MHVAGTKRTLHDINRESGVSENVITPYMLRQRKVGKTKEVECSGCYSYVHILCKVGCV